jgi:Mlc titration factor MtfA (ptsG expression regulator)
VSWFDHIFRRNRLRRAKIISRPFPGEWLATVEHNLPCYRSLSPEQQRILRECVQLFVSEKRFLGIHGLEITDEIRITVAAQGCLLVVGIPHLGVYPRLHEVIVRPHIFGEAVEAVGPDGTRYQIPQTRAGEAWRRGPVVLAWDSVTRSIARPCDGYNVIFHEFAHVLDMQAGVISGAPPLDTRQQQIAWQRVFQSEFEAFIEANRRGRPTLLNPYGATSPPEFFAVVTEHFFEQPERLKARHPALYEQLQSFYRQDPASWT